MNILQVVSISFEVLVALLGLLLLIQKKKAWGAGIALTFAIYVYYDLANLFKFSVAQDILRLVFFIASLSVLWAIWRVYEEI